MIATLAAAALQAAAVAAPPMAAAKVATAPAPAVAPAAGDVDLGAPTAEGLESLRAVYHNSCEVRLYGEYDDMCSALSDQIRQYRAALAKASRRPR